VGDLTRHLAAGGDALGGRDAAAHGGELVDGAVERRGQIFELPSATGPHGARLPRDDLAGLLGEGDEGPREAARDEHGDGEGHGERGDTRSEGRPIQPREAFGEPRAGHGRGEAQALGLAEAQLAHHALVVRLGGARVAVEGRERDAVSVPDTPQKRLDPPRAHQAHAHAPAVEHALDLDPRRRAPLPCAQARRVVFFRVFPVQQRGEARILRADACDIVGAEDRAVARHQRERVEAERASLIGHLITHGDARPRVDGRHVTPRPLELEVGPIDERVVSAERTEQAPQIRHLGRELLLHAAVRRLDAIVEVGLDDLAGGDAHGQTDGGGGEGRDQSEGQEQARAEGHFMPSRASRTVFTKLTARDASPAVTQPENFTPSTSLSARRKMNVLMISAPMPSVRNAKGTVSSANKCQAMAFKIATTIAKPTAEVKPLACMPGISLATRKTLTPVTSKCSRPETRALCSIPKTANPSRARAPRASPARA
jgi:hypothetical protein